ncbi:hypothetical protein PPACK8108_LOCUS12797 [Phakopsora pachyrhizi]|uniref:Rab-GAP TBC domain-containing protein n=1 Tax=Phakopsora pachyrhizi TaxID=170000 RepID=A0AAV0B2E5_PHAPC|nr:hypothetical protein PPACK8108_LOCUS12797 [Phakopsora pachyrhizi]
MDKNAYLKSFQIFLNNNNQSTPQSSKPIDPYLLKHLVLNVFDQLNLTINNNLNHGSRQLSILLPSSSTPKLIIQAQSPTLPSNSKLELELSSINPSQNQNTDESYKFTYQDLLTRLLTVWSALNPGISYVQGMNLIGSVLIYVYKNTNLRNHSTPGQPVHHSDFDIKDTQEEDLSKHFENVEADTCFDLLDLIKIWDSILAIKLNTMTHHAQKTSEEDDSNQIIQESLLLWQQQSAEDLNDELPFRTFSRAQIKIGDKEIEDEPFWEEDFEEDGFNKYKGPWLGTLISRLASRWSKLSYTSTVLGESSVQLPGMSSNTSSDQASSSCFSPQLESPLQSNYHKHNGPRPLLLSSRSQTNVVAESKSEGLVQQILMAPLMNRLSSVNLSGPKNMNKASGDLFNVETTLTSAFF